MTTAPSHHDLLAIARAVRGAAIRDDIEHMHIQLARLRTALVHHLQAEGARLATAPGSAATVARDGQQRLLRLVDEVVSGTGDDAGCNCLVRAAELEVALRRQAMLEVAVLDQRPLAGSGG
jgi:hypothetical protein